LQEEPNLAKSVNRRIISENILLFILNMLLIITNTEMRSHCTNFFIKFIMCKTQK